MLLAFTDGCCTRIGWYLFGEKEQGTFIIQAEKVNENCHYVLEGGEFQDGIWMCANIWWEGELSDKGQCKGEYHASTNSKPNVRVQDDSLQWKWTNDGSNSDYIFTCVDICL